MSKASRASRVREPQPSADALSAGLEHVALLDGIEETGTVVTDIVPTGWSIVETDVVESTDRNLVDEDGEFLRELSLINTSPIVQTPEERAEQVEIARDIAATVAGAHADLVVADPTPRMERERLEKRIRLVSQTCPKRPGSTAEANWALYVDGMTVSAYLASHNRRRARRDLQWDLEHGFVRLESEAEWMESQT